MRTRSSTSGTARRSPRLLGQSVIDYSESSLARRAQAIIPTATSSGAPRPREATVSSDPAAAEIDISVPVLATPTVLSPVMAAPAAAVPAAVEDPLDPRDTDIFIEEFDCYFTAPSAFDDIDPFSSDSSSVFSYAPWFDRRVLESEHVNILEQYVDEENLLPAGIPLESVQTWTWRCQFSFLPDELHVPRDRDYKSIRGQFAIQVNQGLRKLFTLTVPPEDFDVDMFVFRTRGEQDYVQDCLPLLRLN